MAKIENFKVESKLAPFKTVLGVLFEEVMSDCKSLVADAAGEEEKNIVVTSSGWVAGTKGRFVSKDGLTLQLPLNNPLTILLSFGAKLVSISDAGTNQNHAMDIQADLPCACIDWFTQKSKAYAARANKQKAIA